MTVFGLATAAVFVLVLVVGMWRHERLLVAVGPPKPSVLAFELAGSGRATHGLLDAVGPAGRSAIRAAIGIDRWIIAGYAVGFAVLALLSIRIVDRTSSGSVELVGTALAVAVAVSVLMAAALDLVENSKLVTILDRWSDPPIPPGTSTLDEAAIRQAHRRALIEAFERPAATARRAARWKFGLLGFVVVWGVAIGCITVTHYMS